jgi:hypothetical protein
MADVTVHAHLDVTVHAHLGDWHAMSGRWSARNNAMLWTLTPTMIVNVRVTASLETRNMRPGSLATQYMAECRDGWERRVFVMQYGNSGTPYMRFAGVDALIDDEIRIFSEVRS